MKFAPQVLAIAGEEAIKQGRTFVLILGGLDQLATTSKQQVLSWLPLVVPSGVLIVVSSNEGPILDALMEDRSGQAMGPLVRRMVSRAMSQTMEDGHKLKVTAGAERRLSGTGSSTDLLDEQHPTWTFLQLAEFTPQEKVDAAVKFLSM